MPAPSQNTRGRGQEDPQTGGGGGAPSRGSVWEQVSPEPPAKLFLQNSLRNSDLDRWNFGWEHVSHRLERILVILWDRGVKVWRRGFFPFSRVTEKRGGGSGGGIPPAPGVSAPCVTAYASPLTEYSGVGSGGTSNWGRGQKDPTFFYQLFFGRQRKVVG